MSDSPACAGPPVFAFGFLDGVPVDAPADLVLAVCGDQSFVFGVEAVVGLRGVACAI